MAEYINREILIKRLEVSPLFLNMKPSGSFIRDGVIDIINKQSVADVVEVVHGKWLQTKEPLGANEVDCVECSVCRESWVIEEDLSLDEYIEFWHYCPNCGAKMDGDTNE